MIELASGLPAKQRDQLEQGERVLRASTNVVCLAAGAVDPLDSGIVRRDQIIDVQDVADLLSVAINGHRPTLDRSNGEPGEPTLILYAILVRAVDARLPENHRLEIVNAGVVNRILIPGSLRTAVG